jgi:hypothetical protein
MVFTQFAGAIVLKQRIIDALAKDRRGGSQSYVAGGLPATIPQIGLRLSLGARGVVLGGSGDVDVAA